MPPLIGPSQLASLLTGPPPSRPVLLDVRWRLGGPPGHDSYLAGHLPGAAFVDLDADLAAVPGPAGRHPLPDPAAFTAAMRRAGVRPGVLAVGYDDADSTAAARLWWCLRYFGHGQVQVLDGGYRAWTAAGLPVSTGPASGGAAADGTRFTARPGHLPLLGGPAAAARLAGTGTLLDARAAERYRGEVEPVDPAAGHIPGAISAPTAANVDPQGRFLPAALLRDRFTALGLSRQAQPARPSGAGEYGVEADTGIGVYCGSGVTAAHEILALQLAGYDAALYAGSWSEWVADPSRPVATGPEPGGRTGADFPAS